MNHMFPFGLDGGCSFYLIVYVLTLVVHVVLMAYVLAGSLWVAWCTLFPGAGLIPRTKQPLPRILRDWMPFMLSGAITAGVAPLLFVQILYQRQFYSANLLLGWRWMVVIPVLIAAFYLLYVMKSRVVSRWPLPVRLGLAAGIAGCFLFVAFCWTANHLLGLEAAAWPEAYRTGDAVKSPLTLTLRLAIWIAGALPTMAVLASWQLKALRGDAAKWDGAIAESDWGAMFEADHRRLGVASLAGLAVAAACGGAYVATLSSAVRAALLGAAGAPWLMLGLASVLMQATVWGLHLRRPCLCVRWHAVLAVTLATTLVSVAALREIIRLTQANLDQVVAAAKSAAAVGGFELFVVFTLLNAALIAWCVRLVRT